MEEEGLILICWVYYFYTNEQTNTASYTQISLLKKEAGCRHRGYKTQKAAGKNRRARLSCESVWLCLLLWRVIKSVSIQLQPLAVGIAVNGASDASKAFFYPINSRKFNICVKNTTPSPPIIIKIFLNRTFSKAASMLYQNRLSPAPRQKLQQPKPDKFSENVKSSEAHFISNTDILRREELIAIEQIYLIIILFIPPPSK